jgi:hypothetical protein
MAGHFGTWLMTSIVFYPISLAALAAPAPVAVLAAAISLIWQFHPLRARMLSASHRTRPFIARGPAAMASTLSYGAEHGRSCVASCGHLMLPLALTDHSLLFMAAMMSVSLYERGLRRFAPRAGALVLAMVWLLHWSAR